MSRDLKAAARIQETFLPREVPRVPGADFAWIYQPCDELAGDGLNIIPLGDGKVGLYILDVSGHGVASALLSVTLSPSALAAVGAVVDSGPRRRRRGPARHHAPGRGRRPTEPALPVRPGDRAVRDDGLRDSGHRDRRVPLCLGRPPRPGASARRRRSVDSGEPRGSRSAWATTPTRSGRSAWRPGDRLYLYSDGVPEAMDAGRQAVWRRRGSWRPSARGGHYRCVEVSTDF